MENNKFDNEIRRALKKGVDGMIPSENLRIRINKERRRRQEVFKMRRWKIKKIAVAAAMACLLAPTTIIAGGKIVSYVSSTNPLDYESSGKWNDVSKLGKKVGIGVEVPKGFASGYTFKEVDIRAFNKLDQFGSQVGKDKVLEIIYENQKNNIIYLDMDHTLSQEKERTPDMETVYENIRIQYFVDTYKLVPGDYELTEKDKKMMEQDNYHVSYGTEKIEIKKCSYVSWEENGIFYTLLAFDTELTGQEMIQMAEEIIK